MHHGYLVIFNFQAINTLHLTCNFAFSGRPGAVVRAVSLSHQVADSKQPLRRFYGGKACLGFSLPQTPLMWEPQALGLPFFFLGFLFVFDCSFNMFYDLFEGNWDPTCKLGWEPHVHLNRYVLAPAILICLHIPLS